MTTAILGVDFTSAPSRRKPITCAVCELKETLLVVQDCLTLTNFDQFEALLNSAGPWIAALDFPFGLPRKLLANLGWPEKWEEYVQLIAAMGKTAFVETLAYYRESRPAGDKLHLRTTDRLAGSRSPMMMHRVPVGKMFFQGAPRLLRSGVSVLPCCPRDDNRIVVEGYPALVARQCIGKRSYKSDEQKKQSLDQRNARRDIVDALCTESVQSAYGVRVRLDDEMADRFVQEPMGDILDAVLCALQAAWAYLQRDNEYGIPFGYEQEGWIVIQPTLFN
ncbi:MAG TPA: DUF429 domain-containing protein [Ktedonobacteraceae bacterium]|nr:DUF429 domain-containing protein [Ktedonobacteraceae bacterium]